MTEKVVIVCIITLAIVVGIVLVVIAILLYNQMLMTNEINKRLLVMSKETIEHDRATQEQLTDAVREYESLANEQPVVHPIDRVQQDEEEVFDPHTYQDTNAEL